MELQARNKKYLLKNGRQTIDYIDEAGFLLGFCIGRAVQCRYKAGHEEDATLQEKLMKDCNWFIDSLARRKNIVREEVVSIVKSIVSKIEAEKNSEKQIIDYIAESGLILGFCMGRAVQCRYKAGIEEDLEKREKYMKDCNWFIDSLVIRNNMNRDEIVSVIRAISAKIDNDKFES